MSSICYLHVDESSFKHSMAASVSNQPTSTSTCTLPADHKQKLNFNHMLFCMWWNCISTQLVPAFHADSCIASWTHTTKSPSITRGWWNHDLRWLLLFLPQCPQIRQAIALIKPETPSSPLWFISKCHLQAIAIIRSLMRRAEEASRSAKWTSLPALLGSFPSGTCKHGNWIPDIMDAKIIFTTGHGRSHFKLPACSSSYDTLAPAQQSNKKKHDNVEEEAST
jgi:hypothetical protein